MSNRTKELLAASMAKPTEFLPYEGGRVVLRTSRGVFSPAGLFVCNGLIYVPKGNGYLQLRFDGSTSDGGTWCTAMSFAVEPFLAGVADTYLAIAGYPGGTPISDVPSRYETFMHRRVGNESKG